MINNVNKYIQKVKSNSIQNALNFINKGGDWSSISTADFLEQSYCIAAALKALCLKKGDKVAIMAAPSPLWTICDLGILLGGFVTIPIFHNISEDNFVLETTQSETKVIFVMGTLGHQFCERFVDYFEKVISLDVTPFFKEEFVFKDFIAFGADELKKEPFNPIEISPEDTATIIYTSGTTAIPKGVELTQKNIFSMLDSGIQPLKITKTDRYFSFLPLAHIFGRIVNLAMICEGIPVFYISDLSNLIPDMQGVKPTLMVIVPRLLEKFYNTIRHASGQGNYLKRKVGTWAFNYLDRPVNTPKNIFYVHLADWILGRQVRKIFGGHVRYFFSGSARLDEKIHDFFRHCGIPIIEGYGLTEACPACMNSLNAQRRGSIGKMLPGIELRIAENGELLLRGPTVMKGYFKNPAATALFLTPEGWLHTGDEGRVDEDGFVFLIGRLSEKCKTSYGEFINKPALEALANQLPMVEFSTIVGENKPFVTCLLFPNYEALDSLKQQMDLRDATYEELLNMDFIQREIKRSLENINAHLNPGERIRDFRFVYIKASIEGGELSPTLKARQEFIETKYADLIKEMYPTSMWEG